MLGKIFQMKYSSTNTVMVTDVMAVPRPSCWVSSRTPKEASDPGDEVEALASPPPRHSVSQPDRVQTPGAHWRLQRMMAATRSNTRYAISQRRFRRWRRMPRGMPPLWRHCFRTHEFLPPGPKYFRRTDGRNMNSVHVCAWRTPRQAGMRDDYYLFPMVVAV